MADKRKNTEFAFFLGRVEKTVAAKIDSHGMFFLSGHKIIMNTLDGEWKYFFFEKL